MTVRQLCQHNGQRLRQQEDVFLCQELVAELQIFDLAESMIT